MNWSAAPVAVVPPGVVTVTSTVPVPAGAVAVTGGRAHDGEVAALPPKSTAVAPVKPVPVMVTRGARRRSAPRSGLTPGDASGRRRCR